MVTPTHKPPRQDQQAELAMPPARDPLQALRAVPVTDDLVDYTMACVLAMAPSLSAELRAAADRQVREIFGGAKVYVGLRAGDGRADRNAVIRREFQAGARVPELSRRHGLTRVRIWQILGDK